jgi:L-rhamnose isomerase
VTDAKRFKSICATRNINRQINGTCAFSSIAVGPAGARFVTASRDGTARVYACKIEDLVALARQRVTRSLTQAESQQYLHIQQCPFQP